jgi:hypothetical protein
VLNQALAKCLVQDTLRCRFTRFCFLFGFSVEQKTRSNQLQLNSILVDNLLALLAHTKTR